MDYQKKIEEVRHSQYSDAIKDRLIRHYTNLQKAAQRASQKSSQQRINPCTHYNRTFDIVAPCCNRTYACRVCHDSNENHTMDRHKIAYMKCKACMCYQQITASCQNPQCYLFQCEHKYTCLKCNLFDNNPRDIFHCNDCNICRVGKREQYTHCHKCNMCVLANSNHQCVSSTNDNCFVCNEDLFSSRDPIMNLPCNHYMHVSCFQTMLQPPNVVTTCGICRKSVVDMSHHWQQIDAHLATETIPDEYKDWKSNIVCNDCHAHTQTQYHFVYHKCAQCNSYNTSVKDIVKQ